MSTRKSGRATKPRKRTTTTKNKAAAKAEGKTDSKKTSKTTKKRPAERSPSPSEETTITRTTSLAPKRQKQSLAHLSKANKAAANKIWQDYLASHSTDGALLDAEPDKTISITQTEALKKYGLKKEELVPLKCWEKKNPLYGGVMRVFVEEEVKVLGERKGEMLESGKQRDVDGNDELVLEKTREKKEKGKTPKQKWSAYITARALDDDDKLIEEPSDAINQTGSKKYNLTPQDLCCLSHFPKPNAAYGNMMKLFQESEVRNLTFRKTAVLAGVEYGNEIDLLETGKELFEGKEDENVK